jgi:hypothetical protein
MSKAALSNNLLHTGQLLASGKHLFPILSELFADSPHSSPAGAASAKNFYSE